MNDTAMIELYYRKKAQYNKAKKKQLLKIKTNENLNKAQKRDNAKNLKLKLDMI